jgi:nitrogen-specific signal transduction histidine kinase
MADNRLLHPLSADVGRDGRLIRADDAILRLHRLAGGIEGGILSIPALAAMAALTHRIKMRLARAVLVAENDDDIELWVESSLNGDSVRLSISGWRRVDQSSTIKNSSAQSAAILSECTLLFDADARLISASGKGVENLTANHFGRDIEETIKFEPADAETVRTAIAAHGLAQIAQVTLHGIAQTFALNFVPRKSEDGSFSGFIIMLKPIAPANLETVPASYSGSLFGRQLAPALRQPLGRIIANAETIGAKLQGPIRESYAIYAKDIADAARHLVTLVDDLGDLDAVEQPGFSTAADIIELGDVARRVAGLLALKAADHRINILTPPETQTVKATAEFRRVLQITLNLVMNAIRYSPDGTDVHIAIDQSADFSMLSVSDQGTGIRAEDREKIFEKFERLGRSGDGGSGLGLYISRRLARAMGGELRVEPNETGGAKFTLTMLK